MAFDGPRISQSNCEFQSCYTIMIFIDVLIIIISDVDFIKKIEVL